MSTKGLCILALSTAPAPFRIRSRSLLMVPPIFQICPWYHLPSVQGWVTPSLSNWMATPGQASGPWALTPKPEEDTALSLSSWSPGMPEQALEGQVRVPGYIIQPQMASLQNWEILSEVGIQETTTGASPTNNRGQVGWVGPPASVPHVSLGLREVNTY